MPASRKGVAVLAAFGVLRVLDFMGWFSFMVVSDTVQHDDWSIPTPGRNVTQETINNYQILSIVGVGGVDRVLSQFDFLLTEHRDTEAALRHMLKKRQLMIEEEGEDLTAAEQFYSPAA